MGIVILFPLVRVFYVLSGLFCSFFFVIKSIVMVTLGTRVGLLVIDFLGSAGLAAESCSLAGIHLSLGLFQSLPLLRRFFALEGDFSSSLNLCQIGRAHV